MWAIIGPYVIKFGISLALSLLQRTGLINAFEADGVRAGTHVLQAVENVKTYSTNDQLNPSKSDFPDNARNAGETS
jgi:hypothetical protein